MSRTELESPTSSGSPSQVETDMHGRRYGLGAVVLVVVVALAALAAEEPGRAEPESADPTVFSAGRAWRHLEEMANAPSPIGSLENARVRSYLVDELKALGLDVEIQEGLGAWSFRPSSNEVGRVRNVVGRLPGTDPTGRVILAAHYDTVFHSPGASDDKGSVAAILETARALTTEPPLRNDLVVLFTDGEEPGLLGASLFASEEGGEGGVVLNWEGYGNTGPSALFQTSPGNAGLIAEFARSAAHPVGESAMAEFFEFGSSNTDFTVFRQEGFGGLDFSWVDGVAHYDAPTDTVENLSPASVQHHGDNMLSLTRALGMRNLAELDTDDDVTYFSVLGTVFFYSSRWVWLLAIAGMTVVTVTAVAANRRGLATFPRLLMGIGGMAVPLLLAPALVAGWWQLLLLVRPEYAAITRGDTGDPFHPGLYRLALVAISVAVVVVWFLLLRRRIGSVALGIGGLFWVAVMGLATAVYLPGASYLGSVPALAAGLGLLVSISLDVSHPGWRVVALAVGALPGVVLTTITNRATLAALGVAGGYAAATGIVLTVLVLLPLLAVALEGRKPRLVALPVAALVVATGLTVVGLVVNDLDETNPVPAHLAYVLDADTGNGVWVTEHTKPHPWAAGYVPITADADPVSFRLPYRSRVTWYGPAEPADLEPPEVSLVETGEGWLRMKVVSPRGADIVVLSVEGTVEQVAVSTSQHPARVLRPDYQGVDPNAYFELRFSDPPPDGFDVVLHLPAGELPGMTVSDITVGLEQIPGFTPRPGGSGPGHGRLPADAIVVGRTYHP